MAEFSHSYGYSLPRKNQKLIAYWLIIVALLVFSMVILGGVTRLTNSGLSMVEWRPVTGWLPPLSESAWMDEFEKYKAYPEYQKVNKGMSLDEFKGIFAFEYAHRVLGRIIGLAFAVPLFIFALLKIIPVPLLPRMIGLLILGGGQGVMGWVMVKSGLVDHPDVSHYRLTAHLSLACLIFMALVWTAADLMKPAYTTVVHSKIARISFVFLLLVFFQIMVGGFVAGLNAGFVYNEWPMMGDGFWPDDVFYMNPWFMNFLENIATIQFTHRMVAYLIFAVVVYLFLQIRKVDVSAEDRKLVIWLKLAVFGQVLLGIWTLVMVVPVSLGALHQAGGLIVLGLATMVVHRFRRMSV